MGWNWERLAYVSVMLFPLKIVIKQIYFRYELGLFNARTWYVTFYSRHPLLFMYVTLQRCNRIHLESAVYFTPLLQKCLTLHGHVDSTFIKSDMQNRQQERYAICTHINQYISCLVCILLDNEETWAVLRSVKDRSAAKGYAVLLTAFCRPAWINLSHTSWVSQKNNKIQCVRRRWSQVED